MVAASASPLEEIESLKRQLAARDLELAAATASAVDAGQLIAHLRLRIAKLETALHGQRSERGRKLLDQLELQLEDLETLVAESAAKAELAAPTRAPAATRRQPVRKPLPAELVRERVVVPGSGVCACCGSGRLSKLGEDVTETLEMVPRQWKVIQTVRERFACRDCESIDQAPAPFHVIPRGRLGPELLAAVLYGKFGEHQPLNRQSEGFAREGIDLPLSTLADAVGTCTAVLEPLAALIQGHVLAGARIHGDDTPVPLLAKHKATQARLWTYVRDDRPFGGNDPPAAFYAFSRDRGGIQPERHLAGYRGILQADAYAGFNRLYDGARVPGPIVEAACWAHARRKFFVLADIATRVRRAVPVVASPMALAALRRIDAIFALDRTIARQSPERRQAFRQAEIGPLIDELYAWMVAERAGLSRHADVAQAMDYMLKRWPAFTLFLGDGRVCLTNNAAERALRGIALGRKAWLFAGSERGGDRAAAMYTLIYTAKLNNIDPRAWLADVLGRIADQPIAKLADLLPWNWARVREDIKLAA
jgi:transposase